MSVAQVNDKYDFTCDVPKCQFISSGWPEKEQAEERERQHLNEHVTGEPMKELIEFEVEVGFVRADHATPTKPTVLQVGDLLVSFDSAGNVIDQKPVEE